jgi:hypothetical protein
LPDIKLPALNSFTKYFDDTQHLGDACLTLFELICAFTHLLLNMRVAAQFLLNKCDRIDELGPRYSVYAFVVTEVEKFIDVFD